MDTGERCLSVCGQIWRKCRWLQVGIRQCLCFLLSLLHPLLPKGMGEELNAPCNKGSEPMNVKLHLQHSQENNYELIMKLLWQQ